MRCYQCGAELSEKDFCTNCGADVVIYKKIMRWATNIPEEVVDKFKFTLQAPKTTPQVAKNDIIQTFASMMQPVLLSV